MSASGRLDRPAKAAAAIATTMSRKKFCDDSCGNSGPSKRPATPARMLDSAHPTDDTRSALIPDSSVMRALSTTARMRRPIRVYRNISVRPTTSARVTTIVASWSRSTA